MTSILRREYLPHTLGLLWLTGHCITGCAHKSGAEYAHQDSVATEEARPDIAALQERLADYEAQMAAMGIGASGPLVANRHDAATERAEAGDLSGTVAEDVPAAEMEEKTRTRRPLGSRTSRDFTAAVDRSERGASSEAPVASPTEDDTATTLAPAAAQGMDGDVKEDEVTSTCSRICGLAEAVCGLEERICDLAAEHVGETAYQDLCTRAGEDCARATDACESCDDPDASSP